MLPRFPDARVWLATLAFCVVSAVVSAVVPSFRLSHPSLIDDLKVRGESGARRRERRFGPRHLLVAWQVALSLALLATAGLFVRAAIIAGRAEPGYPMSGQILARVELPGVTAAEGRTLVADVVDRIRATPGVAAASPTLRVALSNSHLSRRVRAAGHIGTAGTSTAPAVVAQDFGVGTDYFKTLGLEVLRGREFTRAEERAALPAAPVIIDEPLARELFAGQDPIGQHVEFVSSRPDAVPEFRLVIGLVAGQRDRLTDPGPVPHVYQPIASEHEPSFDIHVRVAKGSWSTRSEIMLAIREAVRTSDDRVALLGISSLEDARDNVPVNWLIRMAGVAFGWVGAMGLAMAVVGLYGVKAYLVAQRTREIGIRIALGATPQSIVGMVVRDGVRSLAIGVVVGFALAIGAGVLVSSMVIGVRPLDPLVFGLSTTILVIAIVAASYLPARRATRVDPSLAFRAE